MIPKYISIHRLDSIRRTDPIGAPHCRRGREGRTAHRTAGAIKRETVILAAEWRPTGRGRAKE